MNASEEKGLDLAMRGGTYSPVTVTNHDTVGAAFLGIIALISLAAFLMSQRRIWKMEKQMAQTNAPDKL